MRAGTMLSEIENCVPALRRYAMALIRNRDDADDLVHDCLVRALDRLHTRTGEGDIRGWLFTIMHNLFISQRRRAARRPFTTELDDANEAFLSVSGGQEAALHWKETVRALNTLPEEQRSVILLIVVGDLAYAQVAQVLGVPIGTVMSRLARGRERLRQATQDVARPALRRVK